MAVVACKACGKEIGKGVKKCVHCGTDQRNFFMKHKIITGVLVLFALGVIGSALNGGGSSDTTQTASTVATNTEPQAEQASNEEPAASTEAAVSNEEPAAAKIGDAFKVGDLVFTVDSAKMTTKLKSPLGSKKGNWMVVAVKVENQSKEAVTIDSSFFKLLESDGAEYETDSDNLMYLDAESNFFLEKINPKMSSSGKLLFAVPEGVKNLKLQVATGIFGTETGVIDLSK